MSDLPRQIRLAAGDYFMHGQDCRMRQVGLPGNVCCAVMRLGNGFQVDRLRQRIAESPILDWLARVRIVRPLPILPALWRTVAEPRVILYEHDEEKAGRDELVHLPPKMAGRDLHAAKGPAVIFDVVSRADGTKHLFLSWNHTLLDARGLELLMNHINPSGAKNGSLAPQDLIHPKQLGSGLSGWWPNVKMARGSVKWLNESGSEPLFSLLPSGPRPRSCKNRYRLISFNKEEAALIEARCQKLNAGFRRSHFYLASTVRALHEIAVRRGNKTGAYLIPVPHDTRRRGASGPVFSNHLSILFYRIDPRLAGKLGDIIGELGRQMTQQIRDRFPESCMAALEMFKPLPLRYYLHHLGKPTRGKFASFCFSDSGETCAGMTEFMGGQILDVMHLVPTWRPPGLLVLFLSFGGRPSALLSWVDDCLTPAEVDRLEQGLRTALLEEAVA